MQRHIQVAIVLVVMLWLTSAVAAAPQLKVVEPAEGATIAGTTVKVVVTTGDFELVKAVVPVTEAGKRSDANETGKGMVHLQLDLQPLAILDQGDTYTFTGIPAGEHQLEVELVIANRADEADSRARNLVQIGWHGPCLPRRGKVLVIGHVGEVMRGRIELH